MVYLESLSLFEIYVYLVVFFVVVYFTEACFGQELTSSSKRTRTGLLSNISNSIKLVTVSKLWIINSIFMLVVLLSLDAVILKINSLDAFDTQSWLANYYGKMAEIFATILAIIAAFYTAIPRNVISARRGRDGKEDKYHYVHTKILQYFLVLYGVIVALSIWGFSAGITVDFPPLVELNWENFFNLVSIGVFETTLLLVPPAIICLYELLRSILFTGNVKLKSKPAGAKIFVDERDTRLVTPNGLMLPRGLHKITIKKKGYKDYEVLGEGKDGEVCINAGTEQEYECELKGFGLFHPK
ncbi:PEGA domain-containing protein [Methanocrinis sp.]|uniref:PEGA domain-containing protein n=1 Tax=Methanocrinis sp. TaxID=3101522 RepID=UPI003D1113C4